MTMHLIDQSLAMEESLLPSMWLENGKGEPIFGLIDTIDRSLSSQHRRGALYKFLPLLNALKCFQTKGNIDMPVDALGGTNRGFCVVKIVPLIPLKCGIKNWQF